MLDQLYARQFMQSDVRVSLVVLQLFAELGVGLSALRLSDAQLVAVPILNRLYIVACFLSTRKCSRADVEVFMDSDRQRGKR